MISLYVSADLLFEQVEHLPDGRCPWAPAIKQADPDRDRSYHRLTAQGLATLTARNGAASQHIRQAVAALNPSLI